jgi:hypothetical protein
VLTDSYRGGPHGSDFDGKLERRAAVTTVWVACAAERAARIRMAGVADESVGVGGEVVSAGCGALGGCILRMSANNLADITAPTRRRCGTSTLVSGRIVHDAVQSRAVRAGRQFIEEGDEGWPSGS